MTKNIYRLLEDYMIASMQDSAHDKEHVYRVLYQAVEIAKYEEDVDYDVLICASLLHDIGRIEQIENPSMCHAKVGAKKAYMTTFILRRENNLRLSENRPQRIFTTIF